ncbi:MAG: hypothetical protein HQL19_07990 [Candidatus Omnitrophica bacterium]|nr:hypothetical protein [Candidatus Omnitrophota bacterium]
MLKFIPMHQIKNFVRRYSETLKDISGHETPAERGFLYAHGFRATREYPGLYHSKNFPVVYAVSQEAIKDAPLMRYDRRWSLTGGRWLFARIAGDEYVGTPPIAGILEKNVAAKYYLKTRKLEKVIEITNKIKGKGYLRSALRPGINIVRYRNDEGITVLKDGLCPTLKVANGMCEIFIIIVECKPKVKAEYTAKQ